MDISIVIVSFNTCRLLDECIASIVRETRRRHEIIVVDNASTDDTCAMLREKYPDLRLLQNDRNVGFARANNQGFAIGSGRYFLMLNPDTVILDGALDGLADFMEEHPDAGICGPRNVDRDGTLQYSCDHFPSIWNTLWGYLNFPRLFPGVPMFSRQLMRYWDYSDRRNVDKIMGCCLLIRAELYRRLGGLDESYFMYFEETDLCFRVKQAGHPIVYLPDCAIIHYGGESAKSAVGEQYLDNKIYEFYYGSQYHFFRKNYGLPGMLAARVLDLSYGMALLARNWLRVDKRKRNSGLLKGRKLCAASFAGLLNA